MGNNYPEIRELLQQKADYQARLNLLPYDGSPKIKEQGGKQYIYIRKRIASRLTSEYVDVYSEPLYQTLLRNAREARKLKNRFGKSKKSWPSRDMRNRSCPIVLGYYENRDDGSILAFMREKCWKTF